MKKLGTIHTYDPTDCTSFGWDVTLYADGHLSAEYHTRWQGSRTGERYVTEPDVAIIDDDTDAESVLTDIWADEHNRPDEDGRSHIAWRKTRRGVVVR